MPHMPRQALWKQLTIVHIYAALLIKLRSGMKAFGSTWHAQWIALLNITQKSNL